MALFSIGFLLVAIAFVRLPINADLGTAQVNGTTWGSVEFFAAALVANTPTPFALQKRNTSSNSACYSETERCANEGSEIGAVIGREKEGGLVVTNRIQMRNERAGDGRDLRVFRGSWGRRCSGERLVVRTDPTS